MFHNTQGLAFVVSLPMRDGNPPVQPAEPQCLPVVSLPMRDGNRLRRNGIGGSDAALLAYL